MVCFAVVLVLHEKVLVCAVAREQDRRRAEAGKGAAEAVPAGERALESPCIAERKKLVCNSCIAAWSDNRCVGAAG